MHSIKTLNDLSSKLQAELGPCPSCGLNLLPYPPTVGRFCDGQSHWSWSQDTTSWELVGQCSGNTQQVHSCGAPSVPPDDLMILGQWYCTGTQRLIKLLENNREVIRAGECPRYHDDVWMAQVKKQIEDRPQTFDNFNRDAQVSAFDFFRNFNPETFNRVFATGPPGTGKTHLARAFYYSQLENFRNAFWIESSDMAELFRKRQSYNDDFAEKAEANRQYAQLLAADVLIIDDLGSERSPKGSEIFAEQFQSLLDNFRKCIIITSNLDQPKILARYGDKITSRLLSEPCKSLRFEGQDYRSNPETI